VNGEGVGIYVDFANRKVYNYNTHNLILQRHLIAKTWFIIPKYEALNPKFETISNVQNPNFQNKNAYGS